MRRLFLRYAAASLVPMIILGLSMFALLHAQGVRRGKAQGAREAELVASTSIAPLLSGHDLSEGLEPQEQTDVRRDVQLAVRSGQVLRLRLRDLQGRVVFTVDGSPLGGIDEEALDAVTEGGPVTSVTHLNADEGDVGSHGPKVVEAYTPILTPDGTRTIGVLEVYLPWAPIAADVAHGQRLMTVTMVSGLLGLWLVLLAISWSVTRRLRRQSSDNAHLATHDPLTGLPNRAEFTSRMAAAVAEATREHPSVVAVIDLDRFKEVNDALGHATGDSLLIAVSSRLSEHLRGGDVVARLGGDEFGLILRDVRHEGEAAEILSRVRSTLSEPLVLDGLPLSVEASIGFAMVPHDGADIETLSISSDVAMYAAKRRNLGVVRWHPEHDVYDAKALALVSRLSDAIARDELVLHYQPKTDLRTGTVTAVEALVRWQHPAQGLLFPDSFLPAAEQTEIIEPLTQWVLRRATRDLRELDPDGVLSVAVNISARSLVRPEFAEAVLVALRDTGTDPRRVILEVTETALLTDLTRAARTLGYLHEAGVRISIDDFGAGYTSLGHLARLPVTELKVDKQFVLAMTADSRNASIVRSVIELGHSLGFVVTAEGVETAEALRTLHEAECDLVQGYYLARPMDLAAAREHLLSRGRSTAARR